METLERSRVCRLCGNNAEMAIDIFDKRGNNVKKINAVLPILVHQMDLLPKHICHPCNYKLKEFYKFYENCLKTDANLKGQLSWMRGSVERVEKIGVPMVQINNFMIKTELPDYDDRERNFQAQNFTNYLQNNCDAYPEKYSSFQTKCSHCGWDRKNNNRSNNAIVKRVTKPRGSKRVNETKVNTEFARRDTIKKNLFTADIFGDNNSRIQTEIPVCNIPPEIFCGGVRTGGLEAVVRLEPLDRRQNGRSSALKREMTDDRVKMAARPQRSRTTRVNEKFKMEEANGTLGDEFRSVKIKMEPFDDVERNLRPRMESIDYSETKRKNPLARTTSQKRRKTLESQSTTKSRKINDNPPKRVQIKIEPQESTEIPSFSNANPSPKKSLSSRRIKKECLKITFDDYLSKSIIDEKIKTSRKKSTRRKTTDSPRRRTFPANRVVYASPYLRSQRGHLRNGKLTNFDSTEEKPKKIHNNKVPSGISLDSIKKEKMVKDDKPVNSAPKSRDCDKCNRRFPSAELYTLHGCYANRRF